MKNIRTSLIVVAIVLALGLALLINYQLNFYPTTVLGISNIYIDPQGYEDGTTKEWRGSFWNVLMTVYNNETVASYKFNRAVSGTYNGDKVTLANGTVVKLEPTSTIEIKILPLQPYWERSLELQSYEVLKDAHGWYWDGYWARWSEQTNELAKGFSVDTWKFLSGESWVCHTPFTVIILKNNIEIGRKENIDTIGGIETLKIPETGSEYVTITNLGKLITGYGQPTEDILMLSSDYIFRYSDNLIQTIKYDGTSSNKYFDYWYGGEKTSVGDPYPMFNYNLYPGWNGRDWWTLIYHYYDLDPMTANEFDDNLSTTPYGKSLVNYLSQYFTKTDVWLWKQAKQPAVINNKMRIYLPYGSMNSLITVKISSELADTIVWKPQVGNFKITEVSPLGEMGDRKFGYVKVKQESNVLSTGTLWFSVEPSSLPVSVNPVTQAFTLAPNVTDILVFEIVNLGSTITQSGVLRAKITNSLGSVTDTRDMPFTLLQKVSSETILTIYTIDKQTREPVSGISVAVSWDSQSKSGITSEGSVSWNLGSIQPLVTVVTAETPLYKTASAAKALSNGQNSITLELIRQGAVEPPDYRWIIIAIIVIAISISMFGVAKMRKKGNKGKLGRL